MKLYALINWIEGLPQITAIDGQAVVAMREDLCAGALELMQNDFKRRGLTELLDKVKVVEFESPDPRIN